MFDNPTVAAVVGAVVGSLLTVIVSAIIRRLMRRVRRVECVITEVSSLLTASDRIANELEVTFSGKAAQSVYLVSLDVVNTGTDPVKKQPVRVRLAEGAQIVDYKCETAPSVGFGEVKELARDKNMLDLEVELLNPRDKITVEIVSLDNPNETVEVYLKNEGVESRTYSLAALASAMLNLTSRESLWSLVVMELLSFGGPFSPRALMVKVLSEDVGSKRSRR